MFHELPERLLEFPTMFLQIGKLTEKAVELHEFSGKPSEPPEKCYELP